jgi:DNA-directed RNA polymerase subunit RPC12/RpoP
MPKRKAKKKMKILKPLVKSSKMYKCMRCGKAFPTLHGLRRHSAEHLRDLEELKMLKRGHIPDETKLGAGFKGKNKIIVS